LDQALFHDRGEPIANDRDHALRVGPHPSLRLREACLNRLAQVLPARLSDAFADGLAQPLPSRRDDAIADVGLDPVTDPRGNLHGVVPTDLLGDGPLGQRLLNRRMEALADGFAPPLPHRIADPLMNGFGEALAEPVGSAIEIESAGSALGLDECRSDLLSQPLADQIAHAILDRLLQTISYRLGYPLSQGRLD